MGALLLRVPRLLVPVRGRWAVVLIVVALVLTLGEMATRRWTDHAWDQVESTFSAREMYRDSWIVCEGQMSAGCAERAAERTGRSVAWVSDPAELGLRLDAMAAGRGKARSFAAQELKGGDFIVAIVSGDDGSRSGGRIGSISANGRNAEVWEDDGAIDLKWSSHGQVHSIGVVSMDLGREFGWSERSLAEALFEKVRVTSPKN